MFAAWEKAERPYPWTERQFLEGNPAVFNALVWEDQQRVGFAVLNLIGDEAHLINLMIAPALRRQGRGRRLIEKIILWAVHKGAVSLTLDVDPANIPALNLYKSCGFDVLERRSKAYPDGEAALIMRKIL